MTAGSGFTYEKTSTTSGGFLLWSRFGEKGIVTNGHLAGLQKRQVAERLAQQSREPYCVRRNAERLASAAVSSAPRHMRSDVDRVVFGRDMDSSETAEAGDGQGGNWDKHRIEAPAGGGGNALMERLSLAQQQQPLRSGPDAAAYPDVTWAGPAARYVTLGRRYGDLRPTKVQPRPVSAIEQLQLVRETPLFSAEVDRLTRGHLNAGLRPRVAPSPLW
jgi:hypothetical protein